MAKKPAKTLTAFRLDQDVLDGLAAIKVRDGVPMSEQVTRALKQWIEDKGIGNPARKSGKVRR